MSNPTSLYLANPHDRFFRYFLGHPERARAFIRRFLPADLLAHLSLDTLQVEQVSFVDSDLRSHQGDLLFQVQLATGKEVYLYFLFEHKSYPDPWVAWQLLRYMVRIWEAKWREERRLAPIVPVVVYHGERRWHTPTDFAALFDAPQEVRAYVPDFRYLLYDLTVFEDAELRADVMLGAGLLLMKYIQRPELRERLENIVGLIAEMMAVGSGVEAAVALLQYITEAARHVREEDVREAVQALPRGGEIMATIAQQWLEQGVERGLLKARREDILALLQARLSPNEAWMDRIATRLDTIDDLTRLQELLIIAAQVERPEDFERQLER